eukprot:CAMPEP_0179143352 /NCGR_PEP_ID=MMETSP0796-20121207/68957_1 /TAXON_ID=73915 /ORGANISM="Pyrodinium bahamense, Strain pbaha01" /LENGTH=86 /DNA_ID=CAMNT_0020843403 /DNA_START=23 /DNA_END=283 /DNA_ORIENTATION=+
MKGQATALDMRQQLFYTAALSKRVKKFEASCNEKMELLVGISEHLLACLEREPPCSDGWTAHPRWEVAPNGSSWQGSNVIPEWTDS